MKYHYHYHNAVSSSAAPSSSGAVAAMHLVQVLRTTRLPDQLDDTHWDQVADIATAYNADSFLPNAYSGFLSDLNHAIKKMKAADRKYARELTKRLVKTYDRATRFNGKFSKKEGKRSVSYPFYKEDGSFSFKMATEELNRLHAISEALLDELKNPKNTCLAKKSSEPGRRAANQKEDKENVQPTLCQNPVKQSANTRKRAAKSKSKPLAPL